jgi:PEP-CTERM motif
MRWQLFETTADWETTNQDRLFLVESDITDVGQAFYSMPVPVEDDFPKENTLRAGSYYSLSLQVLNMGFLSPTARALTADGPFETGDGLLALTAAGVGGPPFLPLSIFLAFSIDVCSPFPGGGSTEGCFPGPGPFPAPEPATLALLGIGLAGLAFSRRKRAA